MLFKRNFLIKNSKTILILLLFNYILITAFLVYLNRPQTILIQNNNLNIRHVFKEDNNELNDSINESCKMNTLNEWDDKIKHLFQISKPYADCAKEEPLSYVKKDILYINQTVNLTVHHGKINKCEWALVFRNVSINDNYALGPYNEYKRPALVKNDFVKVKCFLSSYYGHVLVYEYVHSVITPKKKLKKSKKPKINVMILIFDGVSLSSMKRALPKTLTYLKSFEQFYLFEKHHVIGENTFQNLVPMLTNMDSGGILKQNSNEPFDKYPFLWKNYKRK